jgi:hypothetical protein
MLIAQANKAKWQTTYTVEGSGHFPHDMLRYDAAITLQDPDASRGTRQIKVLCLHPLKARPFVTHARWASFGWRVVSGSLKTERYVAK